MIRFSTHTTDSESKRFKFIKIPDVYDEVIGHCDYSRYFVGWWSDRIMCWHPNQTSLTGKSTLHFKFQRMETRFMLITFYSYFCVCSRRLCQMVIQCHRTLGEYLLSELILSITRVLSEPILPIHRISMLRRSPETPGGPLALKDVLILVFEFGQLLWKQELSFILMQCAVTSLRKNQPNHVTWM